MPAAVVFACGFRCCFAEIAKKIKKTIAIDRIGNLGNSSTMKARLQEEVRLLELAQGTRVRYTDIGVFSAVAGN